MFGLCPVTGERAETLGFRKALRALRARLIHVGRYEVGDDLLGSRPGGETEARTVGVILLGMDNGYRSARGGEPAADAGRRPALSGAGRVGGVHGGRRDGACRAPRSATW